MSFEETIETLSKMFGEWDSLFHTRYKCLNIIKEDDEDFVAYAGKVNAQCERFKLKDFKEDMFKCLIFVQGLSSNKNSDSVKDIDNVRTRYRDNIAKSIGRMPEN